eukprot:CAMPEP_0171322876 /NCGR_PEP_ID=MMETSP0816-20121228/115226_1 /TAXON_ID=420281 /ORGANISM="Proboscia inermis, Strain CCAP1064/1" /LENGTH=647 /DNA_ID=CAMNT_0011821451 /DNA_START=246 /DNA_END=2191 /DNA_ORIENTATION=-
MPPLTDLIHLAGIKRVVIGSQDPIAERATNGAAALHADGLQVYCGVQQDAVRTELIPDYISRINGKLARFGRTHAQSEKRPMGFLHCSVIDSLDVDAFARSGNAFGGNQAGAHASHNYGERDFGAYELAPPPERVWADSEDNSGEDVDGGVEMDDALFFEDEEEEELTMDPMMPWYEQVDAVIATFPKMGNGPLDDNSVKARLSGLQWLATQGLNLPPGVERILVLDATDLVFKYFVGLKREQCKIKLFLLYWFLFGVIMFDEECTRSCVCVNHTVPWSCCKHSSGKIESQNPATYICCSHVLCIQITHQIANTHIALNCVTFNRYEQVDAVIATFPKMGNGPLDDNSVKARLSGLQWLATQGLNLPPGVERILVLDATDLRDIPLQNTDPNLAPFVDIEAFWKSDGRKKPRLLLRHSSNAAAEAASRAASVSAEKASSAALRAKEAYESGDAELAAECAVECQQAALASMETIRQDVENMQNLRKSLTDLGVKVETIKGGEPIDVMTHLGQRSGYESIVWRAGCWGNRGVKAILSGAFQWVSAHLAVDAAGGKFWQLMLAESAVQAACGPESSVMVMAEQEDISLEYCDENDDDEDCVLSVDGRAIRHVRLDCRAVLVDPERERVLKGPKMSKLDNVMLEEAPWFI